MNGNLCCNVCTAGVDGIAFRSRCHHLYCPPCAKSTFATSTICAICSTHLTDGDVSEMSIGIPVGEEAVMENMYQALLQNTSIPHITQRLSTMTLNTAHMVDFITTQLQTSATHALHRNSKLASNLEAHVAELVIFSLQSSCRNDLTSVANNRTLCREGSQSRSIHMSKGRCHTNSSFVRFLGLCVSCKRHTTKKYASAKRGKR
jgi:hypothetical protein